MRHNHEMRRALIALLLTTSAFAQVSPRPADVIVPVVGSTQGQSNAVFRTELQMTNASDSAMSGWLVFRPAGLVGRYDLPPRATLSFADVVSHLGGSGLGSLDVLVDRGGVPTIVARAYDDQPDGTTGVTVPALNAASLLTRGDAATLIAPRSFDRYRFNVGVRAIDSGATLEIIVRDASGKERARKTAAFESNAFLQQGGNAFAGIALQPDDSIEVRFTAGSAIVYATTVDNQTNDSSIQVLRR